MTDGNAIPANVPALLAPLLTRETARALCDAGYMRLREYLRLCAENGWT